MRAALGVLLVAAGLVLFIGTVDRSPWVLLAPVLVALGVVLIVEGTVEVQTYGPADAATALAAEQRAARR